MKRRIFGIPILVALIAVSLPLVALAAYTILTITGNVTVKEPVTVSPATFEAEFYAGETYTKALTLTNSSSVAMDVSFTSSISPVTTEVSLTAPNKVTVPATGSATAQVSVIASKSAAPGAYVVSIGLTR